MSTDRKPPIIIPAAQPANDIANDAAFIFIHGLGDDAEGLQSEHYFNILSHLVVQCARKCSVLKVAG
jgi:hypothetical protein